MDTNMTFRMDSEIKNEMASICAQLGMTTSAAFNIFANAFVRAKGMPFPVQLNTAAPTQAQILADTDSILEQFGEDYRRMAE